MQPFHRILLKKRGDWRSISLLNNRFFGSFDVFTCTSSLKIAKFEQKNPKLSLEEAKKQRNGENIRNSAVLWFSKPKNCGILENDVVSLVKFWEETEQCRGCEDGGFCRPKDQQKCQFGANSAKFVKSSSDSLGSSRVISRSASDQSRVYPMLLSLGKLQLSYSSTLLELLPSKISSLKSVCANSTVGRSFSSSANEKVKSSDKEGLPFFPSRLTKSGYEKPVAYWLLATGSIVVTMVLLGGYTRLSGSGLSMTSWSFVGSSFPLTKQAWNEEFERYKEFPEYEQVNYGMDVYEFKKIYMIEWLHRMLGRFSGLIFASGFAYFALRKALKFPLVIRLTSLLALGGFQGFVGWWMVKSGLSVPETELKTPRVSPYRLSFHLLTALALYSGLLWNALDLLRPPITHRLPALTEQVMASVRRLKILGIPVCAIVACTVMSGALVAGNDAGYAFNTWPKMNEDWIPPEIPQKIKQSWKAFFENTALVQFNHRLLAYTTIISCLGLSFSSYLWKAPLSVQRSCLALGAMACAQAGLGITTLLLGVPTWLGVAHQGGALLLLTQLIFLLHILRSFSKLAKVATRLRSFP